jgi:hypothetical protein
VTKDRSKAENAYTQNKIRQKYKHACEGAQHSTQ